jgi:LCP family protein required for cell wall assembly
MSKKKKRCLFWQKCKRKVYRYMWLVRIGVGLAALTLLIGLLAILSKPFLDLLAKILVGPRVISAFFIDPASALDSTNKRTNVLLLGGAGGDHEGADLTDTMIFASIDLTSGDAVMLSIPRDIWLDSLQAKVNTAYHYGEKKEPGGGFVLAKDAVYEITSQPIHYIAFLNFEGFVKAVDLLGGVEIEVERAFVDKKYPIPGKEKDECDGGPEYYCRYQTIRFEKGKQQMDGETALKFVRSRNAEGEEGTDFARSLRQQKVIGAVKNKILSSQVLLSPTKLLKLKSVLDQYVIWEKDLSKTELAAFASLFWRFTKGDNQIRTLVLDTGSEENPGFLVNPPIAVYDQWVLVPRGGDWEEFQEYLRQKLESGI